MALLKIRKKETYSRPVFAIRYDLRLPALQPLVAKHYRAMVSQDNCLKECFTKPPLIAFRRQANIRNFLIKSKVSPYLHPNRTQEETKKG